jgi:hypothetical protein
MLEVGIAVVGAVVGASALAVSIAGHRHNVRQAERLAERERRIEAREREADERETLIQSSMLHVALTSAPSVLADGYVQWRLEAVNTSNQPLLQVSLAYDGVRLDGRPVLPAGGTIRGDLPLVSSSGSPPSPLLCTVEFTDTSGRRWRRSATGQLQPQAAGAGGESGWHAPVAPIVSPAPVYPHQWGEPSGSAPPEPSEPRPMGRLGRRRRRELAWLLAALVVAVAGLVHLLAR